MSEQITTILKRKLEDLATYGNLDAETRRNALKEELQYYVLNFIYHHPEYSSWIMYGGSVLRIIHGLDRMSVDLDFKVPRAVTEKFLEELKKEVEKHFLDTYGAGSDFITTKITTDRGLLLKFHVGEELSFGHPSKQVHVKIDLNHFVAPKTVSERRPINRDQLSFVIVSYNMASLMASKIAAIFLRGARGVGEAIYEETDENPNPNVDTLEKIAKALGYQRQNCLSKKYEQQTKLNRQRKTRYYQVFGLRQALAR